MPCNQMISMNIMPPRLRAARKLAQIPAVNGRIRKSSRRNIGVATRRSITAKANMVTRPTATQPSTRGLVQPMVWPLYGSIP